MIDEEEARQAPPQDLPYQGDVSRAREAGDEAISIGHSCQAFAARQAWE